MHDWMCEYCGLIASGMLIAKIGFLGFPVGVRKFGISRILMHRLAVDKCRQAMKVGQHSVLGWLSGKMNLGVIGYVVDSSNA